MVHRPSGCSLAAAAFALLFAAAGFAAPADELRDAQKLYAQGKLQPSLEKIDGYLKTQPRDPQGRFLRGLVLTEQKKTQDAIQVFTGLTEDFPELPEPYNNLAVLYASQGNYDKAKSALELAIHTHPSYATAHENLGDIYAQLASRAYDRALSLDKNNTTAQVKLAMVKDLFVSQKVAAAAAAPPKIAKAEAAKVDPPKSEPAKMDPPKAEPTKVEKPPVVAAVKTPASSSSGDAKAQVTGVVEAWARAWSAKDVKGYLGFYAPDFETPAGEARDAWEKMRAERIEKPKSIEVTVKVQSVKVADDEAVVVFRQGYKSDSFKTSSTKTLKLVRVGGQWMIKQERVGG